ncbi:hypothetical protein PI124_g18474 [Phytophthora idaei]|nr:hypothetical protein PI125_g19618 [Phytophthora idaei]KAG3236523.1 hypothetical protein PI124_g18474 [Phytophthora idaei]
MKPHEEPIPEKKNTVLEGSASTASEPERSLAPMDGEAHGEEGMMAYAPGESAVDTQSEDMEMDQAERIASVGSNAALSAQI